MASLKFEPELPDHGGAPRCSVVLNDVVIGEIYPRYGDEERNVPYCRHVGYGFLVFGVRRGGLFEDGWDYASAKKHAIEVVKEKLAANAQAKLDKLYVESVTQVLEAFKSETGVGPSLDETANALLPPEQHTIISKWFRELIALEVQQQFKQDPPERLIVHCVEIARRIDTKLRNDSA